GGAGDDRQARTPGAGRGGGSARRADDRRRQLRRGAAQGRDPRLDPEQIASHRRPTGAGRPGREVGMSPTMVETTPSSETASVALQGVTKRFDEFVAVDDLSLELGRGEF